MSELTARAEQTSPELSAASSFVWEVAHKPVSVTLPYGLIDRLEKEVVENFRSLTSRGSEIGGLLLGSVQPGNPAIVTVNDFELIQCDYSRGPLYRLSESDLTRFERAFQDLQSEENSAVVGYFRSHTRKGLSLDAEDIAFLESHFQDAHSIGLLIRPYATKASTAGIFIREGVTLRHESSYMEFPFRSSQLASFRPVPTATDTYAAPASIAPPARVAAPQLPPLPKGTARANIVPIASRREMTLPVPPLHADPPAGEPVTEKAAVVPIPVVVPEPPKPQPEPEAVAPAIPEPEPEKAEPAASPEIAPSKSKTGLLVAIAAAVALILTGLFVYPGFLRRASIPDQNTPALALRVERTGSDILLTWNRDSEAIRTAQHAVLSIFDGDRHENYEMDPGQLRNGSIVYSPITADVSFRMDVTRPGKSAPVSESVRVLRTRPSPMGEGSTPSQAAQTKPGTPAAPKTPQADDTTVDSTADPAAAEDKPTVLAAPTKAFDASSLVQRLRPATPTETLVAPTINPSAPRPAAANSLTALNIGGVAPAAPAPPPPAPAAERKAPPVSGGQIVQAELITRKEPEYPSLARQMGVKGIVELTATIGTDGKVKKIKVERGHPVLSKAATDAVMQWRYKPCLLNGQAIQSDTRISLNFVGDR